ncbi:MAG: phospholipid carrier-dependent glycosyltransferase, partial [Halioglobus sp.]|nr:phospholipid carrier-dependent glycosyltransferase [Halioglobus sp.]
MHKGLPLVRPLHWLLLAFLLCGGGLLRYAYMHGTEVIMPGGAGDAGYYLRYAGNLVQHGVFSKDNSQTPPTPDAFWAPGYPLFLATLIATAERVGTDPYLVVRSAQIALGTAAIGLTFGLALSCVPASWALLAAALVALSPQLISTEQYLLSETLTLFLLLASLLLYVQGMQRTSTPLLLAAGVGFAFTYMTNPVTLFIAPVAIGVTWFARRGDADDCPRVSRRNAALILGPLILAFSLWALRGAVSVPPEGPGAGSRLLTNLVQGMHPDFHARWRANPRDPENPAMVDLEYVDGSYARFF